MIWMISGEEDRKAFCGGDTLGLIGVAFTL